MCLVARRILRFNSEFWKLIQKFKITNYKSAIGIQLPAEVREELCTELIGVITDCHTKIKNQH